LGTHFYWGTRAGAARVARAARTGGAALAGFARAVTGKPPVTGSLNVRSLTGLSVSVAIERIVDAFCPPGILGEDTARLAIGEALATALIGVDTSDPNEIDSNAAQVATLTFAVELVFLSVAGDGGHALAAAPSPAAAAQRESDIRSLVREVTDTFGTPTYPISITLFNIGLLNGSIKWRLEGPFSVPLSPFTLSDQELRSSYSIPAPNLGVI
jgi:hypothetical protein